MPALEVRVRELETSLKSAKDRIEFLEKTVRDLVMDLEQLEDKVHSIKVTHPMVCSHCDFEWVACHQNEESLECPECGQRSSTDWWEEEEEE